MDGIADHPKAAAESKASVKMPTASACRLRHYTLAEKIIGIVEKALEDELEPYLYVETIKDGSCTSLDCSQLRAINETRLGRLVKLLEELFEIQRTALSIPDVKEKNDARISEKKLSQDLHIADRKLSQDLHIADRKLDFELMKLEREYAELEREQQDDGGFFAAAGLEAPDIGDDELGEETSDDVRERGEDGEGEDAL